MSLHFDFFFVTQPVFTLLPERTHRHTSKQEQETQNVQIRVFPNDEVLLAEARYIRNTRRVPSV